MLGLDDGVSMIDVLGIELWLDNEETLGDDNELVLGLSNAYYSPGSICFEGNWEALVEHALPSCY